MIRGALALFLRSGGRFWRRRNLAPPYPMRYHGRGCQLDGPGPGAAGAYVEVYVEDCYGLRGLAGHESPATIFDVGANIGCFTCFARLRFPHARIIAFEPNPEAFAWLERNTRQLRIERHCAAVGRADGVARFDARADSTLGGFSPDGAIEVPVTGSASLAKGEAIDLLKLDCEGAEWEILADRELLARTARVVMEYHLVDGHNLAELEQRFARGGHRVECVEEKTAVHGILRSARVRP